MNEYEKTNSPDGEEVLATHIAAHMDLSLEEARALVHRHGSDIRKMEEERARLAQQARSGDGN